MESLDIRPDSEGRMVDVPESHGLGTSEDRTGLGATLHNSSLDVCKDVLPCRGSSSDDDEDGGQDRREGGESGDHARVTAVDSAGALDNPLSNSGGVSGHSGDEPLADKEGKLEDDLVDYESDPYELAMRDQAIAVDYVFHVQCHSQDPSTTEDKVCFLCFPLYYVGFFFFPVYFSSSRGYLFLFCRFHSMPYIYHFNDRYSLSPRIGSVDVATPSFIPELVF
jgi:hypothetical protein